MGFTVVAPSLVTGGFDKSTSSMTVADDVKVIRDAMAPYLDREDEIVVVCHSYGGLPGTDSVVGETIAQRRARGLAGGVKTVVYLAAFAPPAPNLRLFDLIRVKDESEHPEWWTLEARLSYHMSCPCTNTKQDAFALLNDKASGILYYDVEDSMALMCMQSMVKQSLQSFRSPVCHGTSEIDSKKIYIATTQDKAVPYELQQHLANAAEAEMQCLECGHSPFMKKEEAAKIINILVDQAGLGN